MISRNSSPGLPACANVSPVWKSNVEAGGEAALQAELQLIIGRLEDFAAKVHNGLEAADWESKRDLIRTLVKRVEVAQDQVNIVFRVDPYPGETTPKKKVCNFVGGVTIPPCGVPVRVSFMVLAASHLHVGISREGL